MADCVNVYDYSRDSCVYVSAEIQGYLDKKGVLGNRSKLRCSLQKSTLYMQKKQGDVMKTIDLKDSHQVRKVTSEITATHFEICVKKKTHVFVCPTSENCSAWVKALQAAMALKDSGQYSSDHVTDNQENTNVYDVCDSSLNPPKKNPEASAQISNYTEPYDTENESSLVNNENEYWEVADVQSKLDKSQSVHGVNNASLTHNHDEQIYNDAKSEGAKSDEFIRVQNSYAHSLAQTFQETSPKISKEAPAVLLRASATSKDVVCNDEVYTDAYSARGSCGHQSKKKTDASTNLKPADSDHDSQSSFDNDEDDSPFQTLLNALSDRNSPVPDYIHPLNEADWKPVEDLRHFLSNNDEFCQATYSFVPISEDPVDSLKSYIETLGSTFRKSGHS